MTCKDLADLRSKGITKIYMLPSAFEELNKSVVGVFHPQALVPEPKWAGNLMGIEIYIDEIQR
jgi:hypothetical protein